MGNKLHGYTRITLRNPISGNILKDVESENTFQGSVISQYLRTIGTNAGIMNYLETKNNPLWQKIVGGIFLFQNAETVGNMYMTAGNRMIGNGSYGFANAADPPELGTFNGNESSASASAITQVYDFATNQANGQISCVCLTSQVGGFMGYGNASKTTSDSNRYGWNPSTFQGVEAADTVNVPDGKQYGIVGNINYQLDYDGTNHKLIVRKSKVPISKASVFDWIIDEVQIDVSEIYSEMNNVLPRIACASGGKFYLYQANDVIIQSGGTWKYWIYDPSDDSITSKTFTNTASHAISTDLFSAAHGDLCFHGISQYYISLFDEETGVHKGNYRVTSDSSPEGYGIGRGAALGELPNGLSRGNFSMRVDSAPMRGMYAIYDRVNDTLLPCNGVEFSESYSAHPSYYDVETNSMCQRNRWYAKKWNNPLYLATINNLNSPVNKTSAQTMKVTYTLTEA